MKTIGVICRGLGLQRTSESTKSLWELLGIFSNKRELFCLGFSANCARGQPENQWAALALLGKQNMLSLVWRDGEESAGVEHGYDPGQLDQ